VRLLVIQFKNIQKNKKNSEKKQKQSKTNLKNSKKTKKSEQKIEQQTTFRPHSRGQKKVGVLFCKTQQRPVFANAKTNRACKKRNRFTVPLFVSRSPPPPGQSCDVRASFFTVPRSPALKRGIGVGFAPKAELLVPFFASPIKLPGAIFLCRTNFFLSRIA
jgi:hypothetical protein